MFSRCLQYSESRGSLVSGKIARIRSGPMLMLMRAAFPPLPRIVPGIGRQLSTQTSFHLLTHSDIRMKIYLTNSTEKSRSWKLRAAQVVKKFRPFMEAEDSLLCPKIVRHLSLSSARSISQRPHLPI